jgi:hypothetical protein
MIVDSKCNPTFEGVQTSRNSLMHINGYSKSMTAKTVSITFYDDFQLVVKSISIPSYEGAQRAASKLIVICAFVLNELI